MQGGKENNPSEGNTYQENQIKKQLYDSMKSMGILDGLKSQLRGKLYDQLRLKNDKVDLNLKDSSNRLSFKLAVSMIADFMQRCDMPYALSVFLPESGISQEILTKAEIIEVLKLNKKDDYLAGREAMTPFLLDIVEQLKACGSVRPNVSHSACQTEEAGESAMNLDQKLRKLDYAFMEKMDVERVMPFKTLEERMMKYKRECDAKYKEDLESEIRRLKEFEVSKLRMEEAQKYRQKLQDFKDEMEGLHLDKIKELKLREQEAWDRIKNKERDIEKASYEHRQKVLKDEEIMRYREGEVKKQVEMELYLVKQERDKLLKQEKEFDSKLKEMEMFRMKLEKEHAEEISRYKSELHRELKDQDFDLHRRKLQIEEDEAKVKYDKQRLALIENKNVTLSKDLEDTTLTLKELQKEHSEITKYSQELKEQVRILNENLRRETEVLLSRDKENQTLNSENRMLKTILEEMKTDSSTYKSDQNQLIENLRLQLNETREMINKMRENKDKEFKKMKERYEDERRRESEQYQFEYEKLKNEITLMQKRLGQEENYAKELSIINNKLQNNMHTIRDTKEVREETNVYHHFTSNKYDLNEDESDDEVLKMKQRWAELKREDQEIKMNIKSFMKMAPESRAMDNPILADRVRNVRYEPQKYDYDEEDRETKQQNKLREELKKEEKPKQTSTQVKPASPKKQQTPTPVVETKPSSYTSQQQTQPQPSNNSQQQYPSQRRQWTASPRETKEEEQVKTTKVIEEKQKTPVKQPEQKKVEEVKPYEQPKHAMTTQSTPAQPLTQTTTVTEQTNQQRSGSSSSGSKMFKPSVNPFAKRTPATTTTQEPTSTYQSSTLIQPSTSQFPPIGSTNLVQPLPKIEKQMTEESKLSDKIEDNYDIDYGFDDSDKKPKPEVKQSIFPDPVSKPTTYNLPNDDESEAYGSGFEVESIQDEYF